MWIQIITKSTRLRQSVKTHTFSSDLIWPTSWTFLFYGYHARNARCLPLNWKVEVEFSSCKDLSQSIEVGRIFAFSKAVRSSGQGGGPLSYVAHDIGWMKERLARLVGHGGNKNGLRRDVCHRFFDRLVRRWCWGVANHWLFVTRYLVSLLSQSTWGQQHRNHWKHCIYENDQYLRRTGRPL